MLRLALVTHAPTAATRSASFPADDDLDDHGLRKARAAAPPGAAARCLASPAVAARRTAEAMELTAQAEPALRDIDYGRWSGRTLDAVAAEDSEGVARWMADPAAAPHGGESLDALMRRVAAWADACVAGRTLVITHVSVVRAAVVHLLDAPPRAFWRLDVAPLSVTRLHRSGGRWTLRAFNHPLRAR